MSAICLVLIAWGLVALVMSFLWKKQKETKNAGTVDVAWAFSFGFVALFYLFFSDTEGTGAFEKKLLIAGLVCLWSFRLGSYLYRRVVGEEEDGRYAELRSSWGEDFEKKIFIFFQFQALTVGLLSLAFFVPMYTSWGSLDLVASIVFVVALTGETIADRQLERFKSNPSNRGRVCREGLWAYSRHPNYFFEWMHWWAWPLFAFSSSYVWIPLGIAALMLFFIIKMTGIPATEKRMLESKGEEFREYQRTTSAFVPWFPKTK